MKAKKLLRSICSIALAVVCCVATVSPIPTRAAYKTEKLIDFSAAADANLFSTTFGGYSIADGAFKPNNAWANTYLTDAISLASNKVISFDFCLTDDTDPNHQFNIALTDANASFTGGIAWHFYYNTTHAVELVTLNTAFGSTTNGWIADTVADYFDGQTHTMTITIVDKVASFKIDGNDVLKSQAVGLDAPYLVFQATSTDYSIDNIKIESEIPEYETLDIDFDAVADADVFTTSFGGWSVSDGAYKANNAWANTYLNGQIPLDSDKEISFDFCLADDGKQDHQFNVGLTNVSGDTFTGGITWHFYYNTTHAVELITLNTAFGNTYEGWKADTVADYFDGQTHTMTITIVDKTASFKIDGNDVLTSVAVDLDAPTLVFQSTSTDYTIDNLKMKEVQPPAPVVPEYDTLDVDFDVAEDADVFTTSFGGWSVSDGVFIPNSAWANTYINGTIPLDEDKEISFDFCLTDDNKQDHQFNVGITNASGDTFTGGISWHFYYNNTHGVELVTLNTAFGNTYEGWKADTVVDYFDGQTHTMTITIVDKTASFKIDGNEVLTSTEVGLDAPTLVFQSTSTDYTIDNLKIKEVEQPGPQGPTIMEYSEQNIDFDVTEDGDVFATTSGGWTAIDGVYKANSAWATTYLNCKIPLDEDKEIGFDFCLNNNGDANHQFNFALVDIDGATVATDVAGHFYHHAQHGELLTLNRDFGNPTGTGWIGDNTDNYNDGEVHAMLIQVKDGNVTLYIDEQVIFTDVTLNTTSAFFLMQATSIDTYVDNFKVSDTLTTIEGDSDGGGNEGGDAGTGGSESGLTYKEMTLKFSKAEDGDVFATNNGGWVVKNGVYKPSAAWATTYFDFKIPLDSNKEIAFDFCLKNGNDKNHQFNFGFVDINGTTVGEGLAGHFYYHAQHGELLTLNRNFGNTYEGWIGDNTSNFNDGKVHKMLIQVQNGKVKICIDETVIFQDVKLNKKSAYFILQATSTDTYVDNLKISNTLTKLSGINAGGSTGSQKYREMALDFSKASDGSVFATNNGGWIVKNGVYKPSAAWATTYFDFKIPLDSNKEISFDFCLKNGNDKNHQFNFGLVDINGTTIGEGLAGHFYQHAQHGELLTLNRNFGNTYDGWIADNTDNFNDGKVHNMLIQVKDGKVKICIDKTVIFQDIKLEASSAYFILQATSTDTYVDNMKLSNKLTDTSKYGVTDNSMTTQEATVAAMGTNSYKYKEMAFDFSKATDGDAFSTNFNGWSVVDGVYKPNSEWATTYPNCLIPLNEDKEIAFDFCMKDVESKTRQFNIGFVTPNGETFNTFLAAHFYQHAAYGELFTLNRDFGNPIGEGWIADNMDHFNDGKVHSMMIRVKDGMVAFYIDGNEIFTEIPLDAKEAYFILQFTSPESYIDNFRISDTLTYIPDYPVNDPNPEGDETADDVKDEGLKETDGKLVMGWKEILLIAGVVVVVGGGIAGAVVLKKKRKGKVNE